MQKPHQVMCNPTVQVYANKLNASLDYEPHEKVHIDTSYLELLIWELQLRRWVQMGYPGGTSAKKKNFLFILQFNSLDERSLSCFLGL